MTLLGENLRAGGPHFGLSIMYPSPGTIERIGGEWDWVWVDAQHGQLGYQDVLGLVRACDLVRRPAIVRVASHDWGAIGVALDTGASGVIVPLVNTPEEARACVKASKFPPAGERSFGSRRMIDRYGRGYAQTANLDPLLIVQIETPVALRRVEEIAAEPGVDGLFYGGDDVMLRLGLDMMHTRSVADVATEVASVASACRKHGKLAVNVSFSSEMQELTHAQHYNLVVCGADGAFLASASRQAIDRARQVFGATKTASASSQHAY